MAEALYRKYRSKKLDEIIGQEHVTQTLSHELKNNLISHAYLFSGPKGVGKTSIARILAHEVNKFPYDEDKNFLDIIEFDAASFRKVEQMDDIIEKISTAPSIGKYKVFIIDEVHMLSAHAFNALLKTLEEPPEFVIFILATTDLHKIPETIISRTQQFAFRPISTKNIAKRLKDIAKIEKIKVSDDAINFIAEYGDNSFRESIGLLDQSRSLNKTIELKDVEFLAGTAPRKIVEDILNYLSKKSLIDMKNTIETISEQGYSITTLSKQLIQALKELLFDNKKNLGFSPDEIISLINKLLLVKTSNDPLIELEIILYSNILTNNDNTRDKVEANLVIENKSLKETTHDLKPTLNKIDIDAVWGKVLDDIRNKYSTLYSIAKMSKVVNSGNNITITTKFSFHQKALNEAKNIKILNDTLKNITGSIYKISVIVDKKLETGLEVDELDTSEQDIKSITNIFGGAEVIE